VLVKLTDSSLKTIGAFTRVRHNRGVPEDYKQGNFLNPEEGARQRDHAIALVEQHASEDWMNSAARAIKVIAKGRDKFTTDAVWALLDAWGTLPPHEGRAMGAAMRAAVRDGICWATEEHRLSARPACHRRPVRVWQSRLRGATGGTNGTVQ